MGIYNKLVCAMGTEGGSYCLGSHLEGTDVTHKLRAALGAASHCNWDGHHFGNFFSGLLLYSPHIDVFKKDVDNDKVFFFI